MSGLLSPVDMRDDNIAEASQARLLARFGWHLGRRLSFLHARRNPGQIFSFHAAVAPIFPGRINWNDADDVSTRGRKQEPEGHLAASLIGSHLKLSARRVVLQAHVPYAKGQSFTCFPICVVPVHPKVTNDLPISVGPWRTIGSKNAKFGITFKAGCGQPMLWKVRQRGMGNFAALKRKVTGFEMLRVLSRTS